jgi:hypothetical protein
MIILDTVSWTEEPALNKVLFLSIAVAEVWNVQNA